MKKLTKLTSLLLAGIMALAMLTACGGIGNDAATAKFEAKAEQVYMAKLNDAFGKEFKNDDAIKNLAVKHIEAMASKETLSMDELWAEEKLTEKTQNWVMICYDVSQSNGKAYVKSSYEAGKAETITPDETTIKAFLNLAQMKRGQVGNTAKFTALGVGAKTINGKTYEFVASADKAPTTDGATAVLVGKGSAESTANLNKALAGSGVEVTNDTNNLVFTAAKDGSPLRLQIGDTADSFNKMKVNVGDMHSKALGLADLTIADQDGAAAAIQKIKDAINTVSSTRGDLGAVQNRLEHTQNNLSVMTENIQDAESTIRDTDVADEMMAYTKNNILVQSAQAMLAQASEKE